VYTSTSFSSSLGTLAIHHPLLLQAKTVSQILPTIDYSHPTDQTDCTDSLFFPCSTVFYSVPQCCALS